MPASLRWNRRVIAAADEKEFIAAVFDLFPQLLQLPYEEVEMDITGTPEISEDAFRSIALKLIGGEAGDKKMLIRVPESSERYFKHANLFRVADIEVVRAVPRNGALSVDAVRENIKSGRFQPVPKAKKERSARMVPVEVTEKAPAAPAQELQPEPPRKKTTRSINKIEAGFLVDSETGKRYEVKDRVVVGREAPADLVFQIPTISKRHFTIRRSDAGYLLEDLRSTNGTYLNGLPVHEPMPLRDGDEIVVAITLKHPKGAHTFHFAAKPA
ncbi:MAG: FHA domain-containing protein [Planctomycetes bacterium]|nr:FHA domain-containing protein [Planctomycetota bacterium]